jgi:hypothetical protein
LDERTVRQNASTCIEVDKHNKQFGRDVDSSLGSVDTSLDVDILGLYKHIY